MANKLSGVSSRLVERFAVEALQYAQAVLMSPGDRGAVLVAADDYQYARQRLENRIKRLEADLKKAKEIILVHQGWTKTKATEVPKTRGRW